jgi:hypothetical protein
MPFCSKCGTEVPENVKFCQQCGNTLQSDQIPIQASGAANTLATVDNTLVWILAFVPAITALLLGGGIISAIIAITINIALCYADEKKLRKLGYNNISFGAVWLVPVYLYKRTKYFNHSKGYFIVWCVMFGLDLIGFWDGFLIGFKSAL